ncbi:MAG: YggS family pyridoxal phosphate-dependent enzyme [Bdellovibrionota bacterium]
MNHQERLDSVRERIRKACAQSGRTEESVTLIAVSKTKPWEDIAAFAKLGVKDFGENYVQEALAKQEKLPGLRWHLIGTLQSNKAKFIPGHFTLFHALDSLSLAQKLDRAAATAEVVQDCLVEVNVDLETTKGGISEGLLSQTLDELRELKNLSIKGLMCIPAPGTGRRPFAKLRELRDTHGLGLLSMGMSADFEDAILEGATHVRVGTTLFGERK